MATYAHAYDGSLTGLVSGDDLTRICIRKADFHEDFFVFDTTQQGDGREGIHTPSKRVRYSLEGQGWYQNRSNAADPWSFVHSSANMASLSGSLYGRNLSAILVRQMELENVTGAEVAVPTMEFEGGRKLFYGSLRGKLTSTDTPQHHTAPHPNDTNAGTTGFQLPTLTLPLGAGTVSAEAVIDRSSTHPDFQRQRTIDGDFRFRLNSPVTVGGPFQIEEFDASLDLDNGETVSGTVMLEEMRADLDWQRTGPVPFSFKGNFSGTVTFT